MLFIKALLTVLPVAFAQGGPPGHHGPHGPPGPPRPHGPHGPHRPHGPNDPHPHRPHRPHRPPQPPVPGLAACSSTSGTPCRCPVGTDYSESVTTALIGATASNVGSVTDNFFDPAWLGIELVSVQGPDNFPLLSIRDVNIPTSIGTYTFSERLVFRFVFPDGSFEQRYEQRGIVQFRSGNGSFSGYWATLKGDRIFETETLLRFSNYACVTGDAFDSDYFYETALTNATNILKARGLAPGDSTVPVSA